MAGAFLGMLLANAGGAAAQTTKPAAANRAPRAARFEVSGGASWLGGYGLGTSDATLTGNTGTAGGEVVLFRTDAEMSSSVGVDVRIGVRVTRRLVADASFGYAQPELRVQISDDFEQAANVTLGDSISQYVIGGELRYHFSDWASTTRAVSPFVSGGVGYLRQLASDAATVENGTVALGGGGVLWRLGGSPPGARRSYGIRADGRVNWRFSGIDLGDKARVYPSAGVGLYLQF